MTEIWEKRFVKVAFVNFILLSVFGLLLRYQMVFGLGEVNYQFLLHAHSHFAFAGWMFFSIAILIIPIVGNQRTWKQYRNLLLITLLSAFGMLISFSFQGYKVLSISFSTLFIAVNYWFTWLVLKRGDLKEKMNPVSGTLVKGALLFLCLSSLGPFALGPLMALDLRESPIYQNAIYFYLHFQMNGFMLLAALGLFIAKVPAMESRRRGWLIVFILSTVPLFLIFTLWMKPAAWVWILALISALVNLVSWLMLGAGFLRSVRSLSPLVKASLLAITIKAAFQVFICFPLIGEWTFSNRNLIIGYIHLLTLGCVMPLILDRFIQKGFFRSSKLLAAINYLYIAAVVVYLALLFIQPLLSLFQVSIPSYHLALLLLSAFFVLVGVVYMLCLRRLAVEKERPAKLAEIANTAEL